jgi:hypothetical protein
MVGAAFRLARAGGDMPPTPEELFNEATKSSRSGGEGRHGQDFLAPGAAPLPGLEAARAVCGTTGYGARGP